ncbi:TPA: hypothetical protein DCX16_04490 [bacterium]|nr:hypothetical protein [bacterium]
MKLKLLSIFFIFPLLAYPLPVTIEGEVIGKPMKRGKYYLINVNDGTATIGIFTRELPEITYYGRYGVLGDRIRVIGEKNYACKEHWGKLDIHADSIEILEKGKLEEKPISKNKLFFSLALLLITLLLVVVHRRIGISSKK